MEAKELRLGNIVECKGIDDTYNDRVPYYGFCQFNVLCIYPLEIKLGIGFADIQTVLITEVEPIPLTEEWLLKFGFEDSKKQLGLDPNQWIRITDNKNIAIHDVDDGCIRYIYCKYVHTLQNVYFALCGEELTIKQ